MAFFASYLLCSFIFTVSNALPQKKHPKPAAKDEKFIEFPTPLPDMLPHELATPFFTFDGIDYDELPPALSNAHYDCEGEYIRCLQNTNYFHYVCTYVASSNYFGSMLSMCTLEINNCYNRIYYGKGVYGTFYANDEYFYQGDGAYCEHTNYARETRRRGIFFEMPSMSKQFRNITEIAP